jgi:hypothetical protein
MVAIRTSSFSTVSVANAPVSNNVVTRVNEFSTVSVANAPVDKILIVRVPEFSTASIAFASEPPPYIDNEDPGDGDTGVAIDKSPQFDLLDDDAGVDANETKIWIKEGAGSFVLIWENDAQVGASYVVTKTPLSYGYQYSINPVSDFPNLTVIQIRGFGKDLSVGAYEVDETWSFTTVSIPTPPYLISEPTSPNSHLTTVSMDWSSGSPAAQADTNILTIGGKTAIVNNVIQSDFTGTVTINASSGYDISLVADEDFWKAEYSIDWSITLDNGTVAVFTGTIVKYVTLPYEDAVPVQESTFLSAIDLPLRFESDCDVVFTTDERAINNNMVSSVMVFKGGLPLMGHLGSKVPLYVFDPNDDAIRAVIVEEVTRSVRLGERRVILDSAARVFVSEDNQLSIGFPYKITNKENWDEVIFKVPIAKLD